MSIDLDAEARALYESCPSVKPTWEQLGEVTKGVWRERVAPVVKDDPPKPVGYMDSLF